MDATKCDGCVATTFPDVSPAGSPFITLWAWACYQSTSFPRGRAIRTQVSPGAHLGRSSNSRFGFGVNLHLLNMRQYEIKFITNLSRLSRNYHEIYHGSQIEGSLPSAHRGGNPVQAVLCARACCFCTVSGRLRAQRVPVGEG